MRGRATVAPALYFSVVLMVKPAEPLASVTPERLRNQPAILPTASSWAVEGATEL